MLMGTSVISVSKPGYVLRRVEISGYSLFVESDVLDGQRTSVYRALDGEGNNVSRDALPRDLEISFNGGGTYVPLELRLD